MNEKYDEWTRQVRLGLRWVDDQPPRQRVLLLVAIVAVLFTVWDAVLMRSVKGQAETAETEFDVLEMQVRALDLEAEATVKVLATDPYLERRQRKTQLESQLKDLDARFHAQTADLIPPAEMVRVLKELLTRETSLQLIRLESLPAEPLFAPDDTESGSAPSRIPIFRHGLSIEMVGDYLSTLRYLEAVEKLPWKFFWESLSYDVIEYPRGRIRLKVLSLSTEEGWIGV